MLCVLVVGAGARWEQEAVARLGADRETTVLRRCVDVNDLLAIATLGQADVALVALDAPGFDAVAVEHLRRHRVQAIGVGDGLGSGGDDAVRARADRIGVPLLPGILDPHSDWVERLHDLARSPERTRPSRLGAPSAVPDLPAPSGDAGTQRDASTRPRVGSDEVTTDTGRTPRVVAVWGPQGAPGRTTLALTLAATLARWEQPTLLVDADPWGGAVAQQVGVVDEVSGLLQAARLAAAGELRAGWTGCARRLEARLHLITGLPRPERWDEVGPSVLEDLVAVARGEGHVVIDTGFSLEADDAAAIAGRPERNGVTLAALEVADIVVVVGTADPIGLARLARGLADLGETGVGRVEVVVNRMRPTLGWSPDRLRAMLAQFAPGARCHFLPEDRAALDRALVVGRHPLEAGQGAFTRAVAELAGALVGAPAPTPRRGTAPGGSDQGRRLRKRKAGTAHRR